MELRWLVGGKISCVAVTRCPDKIPINMYKLLIKTHCPTFAESPPQDTLSRDKGRLQTACWSSRWLLDAVMPETLLGIAGKCAH